MGFDRGLGFFRAGLEEGLHSMANKHSLYELNCRQTALRAIQRRRQHLSQASAARARALDAQAALQRQHGVQTLRQGAGNERAHSHGRPHAAGEEKHGDVVGVRGENAGGGGAYN